MNLKYRNAQKRAWRNRRNWKRALKRANEAHLQAQQSYELWQKAEDDMWEMVLEEDWERLAHGIA